jgi:Domain of unknown function (DUF4143)
MDPDLRIRIPADLPDAQHETTDQEPADRLISSGVECGPGRPTRSGTANSQATWSDARVDLFHYRTKDKVEVDVILENRQGKVIGIEAKAASTVGQNDFSGLRHPSAAARR